MTEYFEDLLADESFVNYCRQSSAADIAKWEHFIQTNHEQEENIANAKSKFLEIINALSVEDLQEQERLLIKELEKLEAVSIPMANSSGRGRKIYRLWPQFAAAVVIIFFAGYILLGTNIQRPVPETFKHFITGYGEKKSFQLPDGSQVMLNAGSDVKITQDFGISSRDIYLEGEAFFDVKHNQSLPFIVHTKAMEVLAIGTAFNVKAYEGDRRTEASLIRGVVEVTLHDPNRRKVILKPNEKVAWEILPENNTKSQAIVEKTSNQTISVPESMNQIVEQLTKTENGDIEEVAWKDNKLVFTDEPFETIAVLLERWYGVKVVFDNESIRHFRFTGTFEKEQLRMVLEILSESKPFKYKLSDSEGVPKVTCY